MRLGFGHVPRFSERIKVSGNPGKLPLSHSFVLIPCQGLASQGSLYIMIFQGSTPLLTKAEPGSATLEKSPSIVMLESCQSSVRN